MEEERLMLLSPRTTHGDAEHCMVLFCNGITCSERPKIKNDQILDVKGKEINLEKKRINE